MSDELTPFDKRDLDLFKPREPVDEVLWSWAEFLKEDPRTNLFTFFEGEEILFIAGILHINNYVCELFLHNSIFVEKKKKTFHNKCVKMLKLVKKSGYSRIQITVREGHKRGLKWAESLGFNKEGYLPNYDGIGKGVYIFSIPGDDECL